MDLQRSTGVLVNILRTAAAQNLPLVCWLLSSQRAVCHSVQLLANVQNCWYSAALSRVYTAGTGDSMQSRGLLEARRSAWQFCSTSRQGHSPAVSSQPRTVTSLPTRLSARKTRQCHRQRGPLLCKAQSPDTQERQAERSESSNGAHSNGNGNLQNGHSSNGSSPASSNGASQNGDGSRHQAFGAYNDSSTRGTLDHMLDSSKQVGFPYEDKEAMHSK